MGGERSAVGSWVQVIVVMCTVVGTVTTSLVMLLGPLKSNNERLVRLEVQLVELNRSVDKMSQNNAMIMLLQSEVDDLKAWKLRVDRKQ